MKALTFLLTLTLTTAAHAGDWHRLSDEKEKGISGMALIDGKGDRIELLTVHDGKKTGRLRLGHLTLEPHKSKTRARLRRLSWCDDDPPNDLEAVSIVPGARREFLVASSYGWVYRIGFDHDFERCRIEGQFNLPGSSFPGVLEGLALTRLDDRWLLAFALRGDDRHPAEIHYGVFDPATGRLDRPRRADFTAPWPTQHRRSISELKIEPDGTLYVTAAADPDIDTGPFASALYRIGRFQGDGAAFRLDLEAAPVEIARFTANKAEGFEWLPGPGGRLVAGSDDEDLGAGVYWNW